MKANQVRPGVLAFEIETGDRRQASAEALRSRGWGPEAQRLIEQRAKRRAAAAKSDTPAPKRD